MSVQKEFSGHLMMSYQEGTVLESAFDEFMESERKNEFSVAAVWKSDGKEDIFSEHTGRSRRLDCYSVKGQPEAVFGSTLHLGRYFLKDEESVCLLDQKSAQDLFGTEDARGNTIVLNGKRYQIVGIVSGEGQVCILPAEEGCAFDNAAVCRKRSGQSVKNSVNTLEMFFGSAEAVVDGQFYFSFSCILFAFNLAASWFLVCIACSTYFASPFTKRLLLAAGGISAVFILSMGIYFSGLGRDYLPTYWSNFEFYGTLWKEKAEAIRQFSRHQEFWHEQQVWKSWLQAAIGNAGLTLVQALGILYSAACRRPALLRA